MKAFERRRRWWSSRGCPQLRLMALEHWDPMNYLRRRGARRRLRPVPPARRPHAAERQGAGDIAGYLGKVRTQAFRRDENEDVDELFADRVVAWYSLEAPDG